MALIDLPDFLTSSNLLDKKDLSRASCTRECQITCQANSQCGTCEYCQTDCQANCQTQYQKCGGCETSTQCGTCQHNCETVYQKCGACESSTQCGTCQHYSQCGNKESSCNYAEDPVMCSKAACENQAESCSWIVMSPCDYACQTSCEKGCQTSCEKNCQSSCESSCQSSCEDNCQSSCEKYCQATCQLNYQCGACQSACQNACQFACQNCQTACEISSQHVHAFITYYTSIDDSYHDRFDKCDEDGFIENQIREPHSYAREYYLDGAIYQTCTICKHVRYLRAESDFEWDVLKGDDASDIYIGHVEWNRFLDLLSLKLSSANQNSDVSLIKVAKGEIISASKFNLIIDKLVLLNGKNIPNKVSNKTLILPTSHLNAIKNSLNAIRRL